MNNNEMMELANFLHKEAVQDVKLGTELTKTPQKEMNTLSRHEAFFFEYSR